MHIGFTAFFDIRETGGDKVYVVKLKWADSTTVQPKAELLRYINKLYENIIAWKRKITQNRSGK